MTANLLILLAVVACLDREWRRLLAADLKDHVAGKAAMGVLSAGALYAVFWFGDKVCRYLLASAASDISGAKLSTTKRPTGSTLDTIPPTTAFAGAAGFPARGAEFRG